MFVLVFFVVVTWLSMIVPYIGKSKNVSGTGDIIDTGIVAESSGVEQIVDSWSAIFPEMTKEEAAKKIQELLSGVNTSEVGK